MPCGSGSGRNGGTAERGAGSGGGGGRTIEKRNNGSRAGCVFDLFCLQMVLLYKSCVAWHSVHSISVFRFYRFERVCFSLEFCSPIAAALPSVPAKYGDSDLINHSPSPCKWPSHVSLPPILIPIY